MVKHLKSRQLMLEAIQNMKHLLQTDFMVRKNKTKIICLHELSLCIAENEWFHKQKKPSLQLSMVVEAFCSVDILLLLDQKNQRLHGIVWIKRNICYEILYMRTNFMYWRRSHNIQTQATLKCMDIFEKKYKIMNLKEMENRQGRIN